MCYTVECKYDSFGQIIEEKVTDGAETVFRQNNYSYNYSNAAVTDCTEVVTTSKLQGDDVRVVKNYTNAWGNAKKSTILVDGEEISVTNNYDGMGNLVSTVDSNGNTTSYSYDYDRKPVATTNAAGDTATVTYDALGLKSASTDFMGNLTTYEYDDMNRLFRTIAPLTGNQNSKTENYYDADGNLTTERVYTSASLYRDSKYTYDSRNRLETVTQDGVSYTKYFYDNLGNVRKMANGLTSADLTAPETALSDSVAVTNYTYHPYLNLAETITNPDGTTHNYSYNYFGLLENESYTRDNSSYGAIAYVYDDFGQLLSKIADDKTESFAYDMLGRLTTKTDGTGITRYTYDTADRLVKEVADNGIAKHYTYDANGNRTSFKFYTGYEDIQQNLSYTYDSLNRMTSVKDGSSTIASYTYDKNSNLLTENNVVVKSDYTYNAGNLVTNKTTTNSAGTALQTDNYSYLCDGNVFAENDKSYTYDLRNRLSGVAQTDEDNKNYTFDSLGNRLTKTIGSDTISYTYDNNNRILSQSDDLGVTNYSYDDRGNLYLKTVSVTANADNSDLTAEAISISDTDSMMFEFDGFNRMSGMETGGITADYEYNSDGLRTSKTVNGERTEFVLDGIYVIAEINADGDVTNYIRGLTGIIYREIPDGAKAYYVTNNHGDVTKLVNSSGTVIQTYVYDEYGNVTSSTGTDTNLFRYCGEYFDAESGLIYLRARYYSPELGRFISEDTHWNPENMIYGDNQKAVKYAIVDNQKVYFDTSGKVIKTEEYNQTKSILQDVSGNNTKKEETRFYNIQRTPDLNVILQSSNLYVYTMNNPINYFDPYGQDVWGYGFSGYAAFGIRIDIQGFLIQDDDGNKGIIIVVGGGGGTPNAGFSVSAFYNYEADSIYDLEGMSVSVGGSAGYVTADVSGDLASGSLSVGPSVLPAELHGTVTFGKLICSWS